jgi:hypothetical protein
MSEVDGQKYSCHASSVISADALAQQVSTLSVEDKKKV